LECSEAPFVALTRGDEGLNRIALRRRLGLARHHRPTYGVHHGDIGTQEPHILGLPHQTRPLHPLVEELLVKRGDLLSPFELRAVKRNEISVVREKTAAKASPLPRFQPSISCWYRPRTAASSAGFVVVSWWSGWIVIRS
jgi:hypothetical protein